MTDNYGRMNESEASPRLKKLLYPDKPFCWVCGATIEKGTTVCPDGIHPGKRPIFDMSVFQQEQEPEPEQPYPPCEVCGADGNGADNGHVFCSAECARCFDCEHRSGVACWYRMNMGKRAGHAWIKRVKRCPKEKHADAC